jgi:nanoRNase/pAp phosphatase (c-di-AMP/oligoRNAs hydrolase)
MPGDPAVPEQSHRLVTRSDMDGLVSAVLLKHLGIVDEIMFAHPKDIQDGLVELTERDILTNLPYNEGVHLVFDHHFSERLRNPLGSENHIIDPKAPSVARVVYKHFGGSEAFPDEWIEMMAAVDKADAALYTMDDVLHPDGWELLSFIMDSRTGLGRFRDFRISNYQLMMELIEYCGEHTINEILELPDVRERVKLYFDHEPEFKEQLRRVSTVHRNLVVLDLRDQETIFAGNRFMVYALYPETNISMHIIWGKQKQNTVFAVGRSIFDRGSRTNVGELMLAYEGGGHVKAGTCQMPNDQAEAIRDELVEKIVADG